MPPLCSRLNQSYQDLLTLKEQFSAELEQAMATGDFTALALLKTEITEKKETLERALCPSPEAAEAIMGKEYFLGPEAIQETFGALPENIPPISFSRQELREAKQRGELLVLQIDRLADGTPLTGKAIHERFGTQKGRKWFFYNVDEHIDKPFFDADTPEVCWKLVSLKMLPDSKNKNYYEQTELLANHVKTLFANKSLPPLYQAALTEWEQSKGDILPLMNDENWQEAAQRLADLKLTLLTRDSFIEKVYLMKLLNQTQGKNMLSDAYTWTKSRSSDGGLVSVGSFDAKGADMYVSDPHDPYSTLGVSFSRSV